MITFIEAKNHDAYRMVTAPIQNMLTQMRFKTETIYPANGELPSKESKLIVTNYFWALGKLREKYKIKTPVVYMTHGLSPWKYLNTGYEYCNYILLSSEFERNKAFKSGGKNPDDDHIFVTGWTKHDLLYKKIQNKDIIKRNIYNNLKLNKNKPLIVYLPTFTHRSKERIQGSVLLLKNLNPKQIDNFVISIHHFDETKNDVKDILKKFPFKWEKQDKYDLLVAADLIVGDISSMLIEALPLDVPIVHLLQRTDSLGLYENSIYGTCILGDICTNIQNLKTIIDKNLQNDTHKETRNLWKDKLIYNFGNATATAVDKIIEIYNNEM